MAVVFAGIISVFAGSLETGGLLGDALALSAAFVIGLKLTLLRCSPNIDRLAAIGSGGLLGALVAPPLAKPPAMGGESLMLLMAMAWCRCRWDWYSSPWPPTTCRPGRSPCS